MLKKLIVTGLILTLFPVCFAAGPHFRKASWGMSIDDVKKLEAEKPAADNRTASRHILMYNDIVAGYEMLVFYIFIDNKLVRAKYVVSDKWVNKNSYLSSYDSLQKLLTEKYGKPTADHTFWTDDLYKDDHSEWGMAVSVGHLSKYTRWDDVPETTIVLAIQGEKFHITCGVEYQSKEFSQLEDSAQKSETQGKL